ncbi:hypothetical protein RJZ90_002037 [Blastomyces dermatitidis]
MGRFRESELASESQLLWEMIARRRGEKIRWRVIVFIEGVKALCRLILLRLTNSRPLVSPPLPEREVDPRSPEEEEESNNLWDDKSSLHSESGSASDLSWTMPRTGLSLPTLPDVGDISNYLISRVLTADDIKPPKSLLHRVTGQGQLAEVLYIIRPLIYALALQKWRNNKKSWTPWLIGFGMEYGCRQLAKKDFRERVAGGLRALTALEKEELRKRGWAMGWWVMRGAFYENITKYVLVLFNSLCATECEIVYGCLPYCVRRVWLQSFAKRLEGKPLIGLIGGIVEDYQYLWDTYYFPTATL